MESCEIVSGIQQTPLIGAYLPPDILEHPPDLKEALHHFSGRYPIVFRELNADSGRTGNPQ